MKVSRLLFESKDEYQEFLEYAYLSDYGQREIFYEGIFTSKLVAKVKFIKELAKETGKNIVELFKLFIIKPVFEFFQKIGWNLKKLFEIVKKGWKTYVSLYDILGEWIAKQKITEWTRDNLHKLDEFFKHHPVLKRIGGVAVAGLLIYIWLTMSFVGDPISDFDISSAIHALGGHYSLHELFASPAGTKMLSLFLSGAAVGLSFPWPGSSIAKFAAALLVTLVRMFYKTITKTKDSEVPAEIQQAT